LDLAHQVEVLHLLEQLNRREGRTVIMVVHNLNPPARYAHHIVAMARGEIVAAGAPAVEITPAVVRQVFGVEAEIVTNPRTGTPLCIPSALTIPMA
jgi:iron complex transport system ATP-binding protein